MNNIISWYNRNRKRIIGRAVAAFVIIIVLWRMIYLMGSNKNNKTISLSQTQLDSLNSITLSSQKSAITGKNASISEEKIKTIDEFVSFCNIGKIQEAYDLISNECKEELFQDIKSFQESYFSPIFKDNKRNTSIENWYGDIYLVTYNEDYLSTGRYSYNNSYRDYITVVMDSEKKYKLNINSYIGRTEINKTGKTGELEVKVIRKDSYMEYEKYFFEVKNGYNHKVSIGQIEDEESVSYLEDKNKIKYNAAITELAQADLLLYEKQTKTLQIKYYNQYTSTRVLERVVFPNIYLNYQAYVNVNDKNVYKDYGTIQINI